MKIKIKQSLIIIISAAVIVSLIVFFALVLFKNNIADKNTVNVGLCSYDGNDVFVSRIVSLIENKVKDSFSGNKKIRIDFSDSKNNQSLQNEQVARYIDLDYDIICINIVDRTMAAALIDKAANANIPIIFFNREPVKEDVFRYEDVYYVGSDPKESAEIQAQLIYDAFEKTNKIKDKNNNDTIEYLMIEGEQGHQDTVIRTEYSIKVLERLGINMKKLGGFSANYDRSQATVLFKQWGKNNAQELAQVELIISNNDDMALGILSVLEDMDIDDISLVGIDGIPEVLEAIDSGKILGTVVSDADSYAQTILELIRALDSGELANESSFELVDNRYVWLNWKPYVKK